MRYCDALTSATGYGYWLFPPMDLCFTWDGEKVFWSPDGDETWQELSGTQSSAVQFPGFAEKFDRLAPERFQNYSPPFLTALPELGAVQIWTGLLARTKPGWSLSIRSPVNLPPTPGLTCWEGIVETDLWFGPLFNNFRITKTDTTVWLRAAVPFLQVQPIPQVSYRDTTLLDFSVREPDSMTTDEWNDLSSVLLPTDDLDARQGLYAVTVRKRRLCPFSDSSET